MSKISTSLYLDKRSKAEDFILKARITRDRKSEYIPIEGVRLRAEEWDGTKCINRKDAKRINLHIYSRMEKVAEYVQEITMLGKAKEMPLKEIRDNATEYLVSGRMVIRKYRTFGEVFKDFYDARADDGTRRAYTVRLSSLKDFCPEVESVPINEFKRQFAIDYIQWLRKKGVSNNTIVGYITALTGPMRYALDNMEIEAYPFANLNLKKDATKHRNMPVEKLRKMLTQEHKLQHHYDLFALSFYLRGMNLADMLTVRKSDISNGRLYYDRRKTHTSYSVKIEPEAQVLMDKYPSKTHLMSILEGKTQVMTNTVNSELKKSYGVTMYHSRHSLATIAANDLGIPLDDVALILGHKNQDRSVTLVYVNYDEKKADIAMRRIIDYVLYDKK